MDSKDKCKFKNPNWLQANKLIARFNLFSRFNLSQELNK